MSVWSWAAVICAISSIVPVLLATTQVSSGFGYQVCQPLEYFMKSKGGSIVATNQPGPKGQKGSPGKMGPRGSVGSKGDMGPKGAQGPVGFKGHKGTKGDLGPVGPKGTSVISKITAEDTLPQCTAATRGEMRIFQTKPNVDFVKTCVQQDAGIFQWIDLYSGILGSSCSDIRRTHAASSGTFAVQDSHNNRATVYCDMVTAGGGWMLVGKATSPRLWDVHSRSSPILPDGGQGWSNRFGDLEISEFRVQFSTSSSMSNTKGHWFYHLANKRPLKQLMTSGRSNGCIEDGVSGIAYTYDLISSRNYTQHRCSGFQDATSDIPFNSCFTTSGCRPTSSTYDGDGSFSFGGYRAESGNDWGSTAAVGCYSGRCLACWGPEGNNRKFCASSLSGQSGGSTSTIAYIWFYVR